MDNPFEDIDIFSVPATKHGPATGKFQPKGRLGPKKGPSSVGTSTILPNKEYTQSSSQTYVVLTHPASAEDIIPANDGSRGCERSSSGHFFDSSVADNAQHHTLHAKDVSCVLGATSVDENAQVDKDRSEKEEAQVFNCMDLAGDLHERDAASSPAKGHSSTEFQSGGEPCSAVFSLEADPVQGPNPQDVNVETEYPNVGSFLSNSHDDIFDYSSLSFDDAGDLVTQLPDIDASVNVSDLHLSDAQVSGDAIPPVTATSVPSDLSHVGGHSVASSDNLEKQQNVSPVRASRQLKKRETANPLVEESNNEANEDASNSNTTDNSGEDQLCNDVRGSKNNSLDKKRTPRNVKKSQEKQNTDGQKKRLSNEAPEQTPKKPPKKFSHSTQRNKRRLDENLLQTPEDEIDFRKLRMKDLILFAEHKERLANKKDKPAKTSRKQSAEKPLCGDASANEERSSVPEQGRDSFDEVKNAQSTPTLFNYQSFMEKTPRTRWSMQDTELFYAGIRQFGTDLAMIKELFPNLTRQQVKLKYKKEERQNPLRLSEALASRAEDHSHFQLVIERLQAAAQAAKESSMAGSVGMSGDEEAVNSAVEINEEAENLHTVATNDPKVDAKFHSSPNAGIHDSPKPDESDEEDIFDRLNSYKSEF